MMNTPFLNTPFPLQRAQRGAVLIITLIILVVMLISAAALVRSFDISLTTAGNLAFKRDLAQQSEQAAQAILTTFRPGGTLAPPAARAAHNAALNYSAIVLPSNPQGIPLALLAEDLPAGVGTAADIDAGDGVTLRYVVDRLCTDVGEDATLGADRCTLADATNLPGGSSSEWLRAERASSVATGGAGAGLAGAVAQPVVYRVSVRATGPRNTQSFFQTTFSCCDS